MAQYTISASRIGAVLGVDPRKSPLALYHELKGEIAPLEDNEVLLEGREFESAICRIACRKYELFVETQGQTLADGLITGTTDYVVKEINTGKTAVLEIKNTRHGAVGDGQWGDAGTDVVPLHYWFQVQVYTWLLRKSNPDAAEYGLLAAHLNSGTVLYKIPLDMKVIEKVQAEVAAFVQRLETDNPPDPKDEADMRSRWLVREEAVAQGGMEQLEWCRKLRELSEARRSIEKQESELKTLLLGFAKECSKITIPHPTTGEPVIIATLGCDRQFDAVKFQHEQPVLASMYMRLDTTRLGKEQRSLYEQYMKRPETAQDQKRTIRIKEVQL